jgi:5,10-methylenetetrahydromethanopterin reductase
MNPMKLGLTFYSVLRMPIQDILQCAAEAEKKGFQYITVAESFYRDGFALASAIAGNTRKVLLGTSVMPIYTRTPFQLAMGTATLNEISNGRIGFLGLGVGYGSRTEQYFGVKQRDKTLRMKEYVQIIRKLLSGDSASFRGKFFDFDRFPKMTQDPLKIPIFFGSSGPKMLTLAGRIGNGVILNSLSTPEYVTFAKKRIALGANEAGRDPNEIEIGHSIIYSTAENREEAANSAKEDILFYLSYPELDPVINRSPFNAEAMRIRKLYVEGRKKEALSLITEEMLETFAVYGTAEECTQRLRKFLRRGITLPIIRVSSSSYNDNELKRVFMRAIESLTHFSNGLMKEEKTANRLDS